MGIKVRWEKIRPRDYAKAESFLRTRENRYVSACARFLNIKNHRDEIWALPASLPLFENEYPYSALLIYSRHSLYPVLDGQSHIPLPSFLGRTFFKVPVHSIQGPKIDVEILEKLIKEYASRKAYSNILNQRIPVETIDYDLMTIDRKPSQESLLYGPADLVLRPPEKKDVDNIFQLQAAYEREEVLIEGSEFNPAACRSNLERILKNEEMLLACRGSVIAGKINTNAKSFNRYQIGGVYVIPSYRGQGIAVRMTAAFIDNLISKGCGTTLFVKKTNPRAMSVYRRTGFSLSGDYRISYL